uniref:Uncharacterized protein n=1 Tax=Arundo donax TaxID=35708 RepID=A0A0A9DRG4_ARUDO
MDRLQIYETRFCPQYMNSYIHNLTSSYTDKSNELSMVSASVIMFVLAGLFFNLNLFSGLSDVSAILDPRVRIFLTSALSLFITVMSTSPPPPPRLPSSVNAVAAPCVQNRDIGGGGRSDRHSSLSGHRRADLPPCGMAVLSPTYLRGPTTRAGGCDGVKRGGQEAVATREGASVGAVVRQG